ncbi:MAG: hypothetical protein LBE62_09145, partial [Azonexus sp.]|nr:hypothetical protein [Azonexus sp.]
RPPDVGKWLPGYALHLFPHIGQSGQFMCYKTGQIYLLPTSRDQGFLRSEAAETGRIPDS